MALLFERQGDGYGVEPTADALMVEPFASIWARDESPGKRQALRELAYIEFMVSMARTNPFRQFPEEGRAEEVSRAVMGKPGYEPDGLVRDGMDRYRSLLQDGSTTYSYYQAAKVAAEKMQEFFRSVDLNAINPKTLSPMYKPKDLTAALNDTEKVLANLKALERKVEEEFYETVRTKAQKRVPVFANPEVLRDAKRS